MRKYISVIVIVAALVVLGIFNTVSNSSREKERPVETGHSHGDEVKILDATLIFNKVMVLETSKGNVEIAVMKKDIPKASKRMLSLAKKNSFKDIAVKSANDWHVQFEELSEELKPLKYEKANNLNSSNYAVGLARRKDQDSGTSSIFILREPSFSVADGYTIFGYVVKGQDVVDELDADDTIISSSVRDKTADDDKAVVAIMKQGTKDLATYTQFQMAAHAAEEAEQAHIMDQMLPGEIKKH